MALKAPMRLRVLLALVACMPSTSAAQSQLPAGYFLAKHTPLPDSLIESRAGGSFRIEVVRIAADSAARRALVLAESVFPNAEVIEHAAAQETLDAVQKRLQAAAQLRGPRWWWDDFDAVLTPYAITAAAVDYYVTRVRARSEEPNPFAAFSEGRPHNGAFSYRATVTAAPSDGPTSHGHIVRMTLHWSYWCGMLCAVSFRVCVSSAADSSCATAARASAG